MPLYEYRCENCREQFEAVQPTWARVEDTVCPKCQAKRATRLMSAFASKVVGTHKPGFKEMKAYDMLNERMAKFAKLPPVSGQRDMPAPNVTYESDSGSSSTPSSTPTGG